MSVSLTSAIPRTDRGSIEGGTSTLSNSALILVPKESRSFSDPEVYDSRLMRMTKLMGLLENESEMVGLKVHFSFFCPLIENDLLIAAIQDGVEVAGWDYHYLVSVASLKSSLLATKSPHPSG
jgi:hypothetical protein